MTSSTNSQPSPPPVQMVHEALRVLRQRWKSGAAFFAGVMTIIVLGLIFAPRKYASDAKLFVRLGRESIGLDPTATTGQTSSLQQTRENEINSVVDMLESRQLLESVVRRFGVDVILDRKPIAGNPLADVTTAETAEQPDGRTENSGEPTGSRLDFDKAVRAVGRSIRKSHTKHSNVISLTCKARTPQLAQGYLTAYVDAFHRQHMAANRTSGSYQFFQEQTSLIGREYREVAADLRDRKNKLQAVSIEGRRSLLHQQLDRTETAMLEATATLAGVQATIDRLNESLDRVPTKLVTQEVTGFPDDALGETRKQLMGLQLREEELTAKYTAHHPLVIAIRRRADEAESLLASTSTPAAQSTNAENPTWQKLQQQFLEADALAASWQAKVATLEQQHASLKEQIHRINDQESEITELEQRVGLLRGKLGEYSNGLEQARIDQALERERISNVNLVQPPTFVVKPVSPRKLIVLVLGFLFAVSGGTALPFLREYFNGTLRLIPAGDPVPAVQTMATAPVARYSNPTEGIEHGLAEVSQLVDQAAR